MPERLDFELDPAVIHHLMYSQAGSIAKSLVELLMNGIDAHCTTVRFTLTRTGFTCSDDGSGFATREAVMRYFRRVGTPHIEGDAKFGRFRLGRLQIMPHASTIWTSNQFWMHVDPKTMGYAFDFDELKPEQQVKGCTITGTWYEPMSQMELLSTEQEVRDLVRYTPVPVELNGRVISRDPARERWDFEDEHAYYRAKVEGAVAIYNLGVLVRQDPAQLWGAGGTIVSKRAIALNVSRTEILRKTCDVWKEIAAQFGRMAHEVAARLGDHRKTEARREKAARDLLAGSPQLDTIALREEVITLLPGKRHVSFDAFLRNRGQYAVVEDGFDVPRGEAIARERLATLVHPQTLTRFGCEGTDDFIECLERAIANLQAFRMDDGRALYFAQSMRVPAFVSFATLRDAFVERTEIVSEKDAFDRETRRAWTALRDCIRRYAYRSTPMQGYIQILAGRSPHDAWTDGETYIAINVEVVKALRGDPVRTAARILALVDHELAHEGDSLDCGHDEAFWQRHHDRTLDFAAERQHVLHVFLTRYTRSLQMEGKHRSGRAQRERYLVELAGTGRAERGLPPALDGIDGDPLIDAPASAESMTLIQAANIALVERGKCPPPADWEAVLSRAREARAAQAQANRDAAARRAVEDAEESEMYRQIEIDQLALLLDITVDQADQLLACEAAQDAVNAARNEAYVTEERARIAHVVGVKPDTLTDAMLRHLWEEPDRVIQSLWAAEPWHHPEDEHDRTVEEMAAEIASYREEAARDDPRELLDAAYWYLLRPGETGWSVRRNAAAAGFAWVPAYLQWRHDGEAPSGVAGDARDSVAPAELTAREAS